MTAREPFRVAAAQVAPVFLDLEASVQRAVEVIDEARAGGAELVVFPEGFLPAYPLWVWFIPPGRTAELRELYAALVDNAVSVPGPATDELCRAARQAGIHVAMPINELNVEASGTTLYNTLLMIDSEGRIVGKHRKLVPTAAERLVWAQGDGSDLGVWDLTFARTAGLLCWESYMPLLRYAMYAWGAQLYLAPTWDRGEPWISTLRHVAKEGRVYVIGVCSAVRRDDIPSRWSFRDAYLPEGEWLNPGLSAIIDPDGKFLVEPVAAEERILFAEVRPELLTGPRFQLDVAGHYGRPDLFELVVRRRPQPGLTVDDEPPPAEVPGAAPDEG